MLITLRNETVAGVHADAEAGTVAVALDDRGASRPQDAVVRRAVAALAQVGVGRVNEPEAGVYRVVVRLVVVVVEAVGDHPLTDVVGEYAQHLPRLRESFGRQQQPRQRNERVAPPVGEPGVSGQHAGPVAAVGAPAVDDEVVGGTGEALLRRG